MSSRSSRGPALAAALAGVAGFIGLSAISRADGPAVVCPAIDRPAPVSAPAARAFIDPATGALRPPTAEERSAVAARKRAARAMAVRNLQVVVHPDGMRSVDLGDAFLFDLVVETRPDGSIGYRCVPRSGAHPAAPKEER